MVDRVNAVVMRTTTRARPESALVTSYVIIPLTIHRINFDAFPENGTELPYSLGLSNSGATRSSHENKRELIPLA